MEKTKKNKKKQKVQTHGQGLGRGLAGDMGLNFLFFLFFGFSMVFCSLTKTSRTQKKQKKTTSSDPWARSGLSTHKPKNQKNKKPKNQKNKKKTQKKTRLHTPRGGGQMQSVGSCLFVVFFVFWFFGLCVDSHCRCAEQRLPGTVSGCTRSKVDTLQYSNVCYDIVHSANEQQREMEFNFVRLRHMLLDLCTGNAAICALPQWPVLEIN